MYFFFKISESLYITFKMLSYLKLLVIIKNIAFIHSLYTVKKIVSNFSNFLVAKKSILPFVFTEMLDCCNLCVSVLNEKYSFVLLVKIDLSGHVQSYLYVS